MKLTESTHSCLRQQFLAAWGGVLGLVFACCGATLSFAADNESDFFEAKIRPLLITHCYECHSLESGESSGNLRLDSAAASRRGGDRGPAVVPGNVEQSLLLRAVSYSDPDMEMPPSGKLPEDQIALLREWIAAGATDPREEEHSDAPEKKRSPLDREPSSHWAFVPPQPAPPVDQQDANSEDPIDDLLVKAGTAAGLSPSPLIDRERLIRRVYFDLAGVVPEHAEIKAFVADRHPLAYERLVDRLLASPEFGERFGRHWLDVARYADTVGYALGGQERRLIGSERYRDWVIRAFSADMPYAQMIRHQLAGDRTDPKNEQGHLDAMGFLTIGRRFLNRFDIVDDRIDVITRGLMGITVTCARCHDHKFDPVPTKDYYALAGILLSSVEASDGASPLMMKDVEKPHDERIMLRGQPGNRGDVAPRQFLTALRRPDEPRFNDGSGRLELAERIVSPDNPLTYRVMANRIWAHLIGQPLVDSTSDFGFRTEPPAVPAVLDELAAEFANHQSIKAVVRRILLTATYQRSVDASPQTIQRDPDNRYALRANRRRRDFESLRDSMLVVAGAIDRTLWGEPVDISVQDSRPRRTVYAFVDRQNPPGLFRTFDVANPDGHTPARHYTTVPQQALFLMNSPIVMGYAVDLNRRVTASLGERAQHDEAWIKQLFEYVLQRTPSASETQMARQFLSQPNHPSGPIPDPRRLWENGTATIDPSGFVKSFAPFKHFKDKRWQYGETYPDPELGHAQLAAESGHPGGGVKGAVVRRFRAPGDGTVTISGLVSHKSDKGDGIRATFAIGETVRWQEVQKSNHRPIESQTWPIKKDQFLDVIADDNGSTSFDSFVWRVNVRFESTDGRIIETNSADDFSGPLGAGELKPLNRREQLAQMLLLSNEFAFVD